MTTKRFLVPIGAAIAALLPFKIHAAIPVSDGQASADTSVPLLAAAKPVVNDPLIREMHYIMGSEAHALLLRQSSAGIIYAGHGSHASHGSHGSHSSHSSHRSGY